MRRDDLRRWLDDPKLTECERSRRLAGLARVSGLTPESLLRWSSGLKVHAGTRIALEQLATPQTEEGAP